MNRSGYSDDWDGENWRLICWRGAVKSAIRGRRGQAFLKELLGTLDAMPERRLIAEQLIEGNEVCAMGAVGRARGIDMSGLNVEDYDDLAQTFGISAALVREIEYENDGDGYDDRTTPEQRFDRVRRWVVEHIKP